MLMDSVGKRMCWVLSALIVYCAGSPMRDGEAEGKPIEGCDMDIGSLGVGPYQKRGHPPSVMVCARGRERASCASP